MQTETVQLPITGSGKGGKLLVTSTSIAALGSFLFGFDTAVISGTTDSLRQVYSLNNNLLGFTVSSALIGTILGALIVGKPCDKWGRRCVLVLIALLYLISAIGCGFAWNWYALLLSRFLGGIAVGAASVVSPMYITEIAPPQRRGMLVAISQLSIVIGILMAYFSNFLIVWILGPENTSAWRWMFGIQALPAVLFFLTAFFIPESPRWLVKKARLTEAESVFAKFGYEESDKQVAEIAASLNSAESSALGLIFNRKYLRPLMLALMIAAFNQLDGINAIIYYTADIFRMAGYDKADSMMQAVIIGLASLVMTIVAITIIDRVGRKALLLVGSVTFVISHGLAAWVFYSHAHGYIVLFAMMGIVGTHAYSQGAVVWVCINELLPNAIRATGSAIACFLIWVLCAAVSWIFPVIAAASGAFVFAFFAVMMVLQFVFVLYYLPETRGISLEELEKRLGVAEVYGKLK